MNTSTLEILLAGKLQALNTIGTVGITWWVSSVVFCGTVLGTIWVKRSEIARAEFFGLLRMVLGFFFISIVAFGVWIAIAAFQVDDEISAILEQLGSLNTTMSWQAIAIIVGTLIGTTSYLLVTSTWFVLWRAIEREHRKS